jgi:hypothetical protein
MTSKGQGQKPTPAKTLSELSGLSIIGALKTGRNISTKHSGSTLICSTTTIVSEPLLWVIATGQHLNMMPGRQLVHIAFERAQMGEHAILRQQLPQSLKGRGICRVAGPQDVRCVEGILAGEGDHAPV